MVYRGTTVGAGTARAVVTDTGRHTEIGRVGELVSALGEDPTPLEVRLDALGRRLVWMALAVAGLVTLVGLLRGEPVALVVEMGIALAVAAVPEALPAVATIALAVGLHRMARRHALVRRLPAVETLGSITVVCTDKTRTLTSGDMTVVEVWADGRTVDLLAGDPRPGDDARLMADVLETGSVASRPQADRTGEGEAIIGDPVDRALLVAASRAGLDRESWTAAHPEMDVLPFSSERQMQAAFHAADDATVACVKGGPGRVLSLCDRLATAGGPVPLDDAGRARVLAANEAMAGRALRVLGVARGPVASTDATSLTGLTFVGFVGLLDPPAAGVEETIAILRTAGLRTIMLTGDQRLTADAIGRRLGVVRDGHRVVDGAELERLSDVALGEQLADIGAFSRVSPEHKLRIVGALQARGEIVAMLGDGVNDAPALKKADVGVAMGGRGTDAAREASDIVLRDDRFSSIAAAVQEGRVIYANIRKFVFYLFSCNVAEVLVLLVPGVLGWPAPLVPLQVLWLNLVTDTFPALALAMEPADTAVMRMPPRRPDEALLSRAFLQTIGVYASMITGVVLAVFAFALDGDLERARTMAFSTLAVAQIFHLGNARSAGPVLRPARALANVYALGAVALSVGLQVAVVHYEPLASLLQLVPLTAADWAVVVAAGVIPGVAGQVAKLLRSGS
jgi:Ca2+-transporting ATPase